MASWKAGNPGCCECTCNWTFTVTGCGVAQSGATVNLRQSGSLIGTGTTNSSGQVTIDVPAGTYDVEVGATDSRFATYTASVAHTCGQTTTVALPLATGFICGSASCFCTGPLPSTVFLTGTDQDTNAVNDTCIYGSPPAGYPGTPPTGVWFGQTLHPISPSYGSPYYYVVACTASDIRIDWVNASTGSLINFYKFDPASSVRNVCNPFNFPDGVRLLFGFGGTDWAVT